MGSGTLHPAPPNQRRTSHLTLVAFDSWLPGDPTIQREQGAKGLPFEGAKGVRVQLPSRRGRRTGGTRPALECGPRPPRPPRGAGEPIGTLGCHARRGRGGLILPRERCAAARRRRAHARPAHRHSRRVQREALVVVVPGPIQRVLQLRPRTPLGLADPLLALVVHPARSPAGPATTSAKLASCHQRPPSRRSTGGTETPFALAWRL